VSLPPHEPSGLGWPGEPAPEPRPSAPVPSPPVPSPPVPSPPSMPPLRPWQSPEPVAQPIGRPATVTAAAIILYILAGLQVVACFGINTLASSGGGSDPKIARLQLIISAILAGSAGLNALFGYFVMQGRRWAQITAVVLIMVGIVISLFQFANHVETNCIGIVINVVLVFLLCSGSARQYFWQTPPR
jgi:cytochrome c oxidase subunit IV